MIVSCALTIVIQYHGSEFDPVQKIQQLKSENRRDDALDLARFYRENQTDDSEKFARLETDLEYTTPDKIKSVAWNGVVKGEVYDSYSGIGAISADLCVVGDIRDLGIQFWKFLTGANDYNGLVTILSGTGICLSGATFLNGTNALAKNTIKYLKKIPASMNRGLLKEFLSGKVTVENSKKIWELLKKTIGQFREPYPASVISKASNISIPHQT
jgi:hypothetical protein